MTSYRSERSTSPIRSITWSGGFAYSRPEFGSTFLTASAARLAPVRSWSTANGPILLI